MVQAKKITKITRFRWVKIQRGDVRKGRLAVPLAST